MRAVQKRAYIGWIACARAAHGACGLQDIKLLVKYSSHIRMAHLGSTGSQKRAHKQLNSDKKWIPSLKSRKATKTLQTCEDLVKIASDFYKNLYDDENYEQCYKDNLNYNWETNSPVQLFNADEIIKNIDKLKIEKSPGPDNIPNEALKLENLY
ncbi:hypothetical protein EVAR_18117_1 [Eumeta japonica]|uniref:Uncharacterized protein n=1 Tax=Eumeta variegata TaxID=151549 RepID=A0A4C1VIW7_EUMVA|nr:hypothetical protein EVAR_18117_1 [Eumeta japonica]